MSQFVGGGAPRGDGFVELSRSKLGRVIRKKILQLGGPQYTPAFADGKVNVDAKFADTMIANSSAGVADIVQIPKVDTGNNHTEDPDRNIGEVIKIEKAKDGIYAHLDVRVPEDAAKMGVTLLGASAMLHLNYEDTRTGKKCGPTLLHTAITNRPYVTNLGGFEEIIAGSQHGADMNTQVLVMSQTDNDGPQ